MTKVYFKNACMLFTVLVTLSSCPIFGQEFTGESKIILESEKQALDKWINRDVWGYLNLFAPDATYFDPSTKVKLRGYEAIKDYIEPWNGKIYSYGYKMINIDIKLLGNVGVLTYNLLDYNKSNDTTAFWNSSEIYKKIDGNWKVIHSHWSLVDLKK